MSNRGAIQGPPVWSLRKMGVVVEFELKAFLNSIGGVIGQLIVEPVGYTALLVAGLQGWAPNVTLQSGETVNYLTFAFPGILAMQLVRAFGRVIYRTTVDRRWGLQALKFISGTGLLGYVIGMAVVPAVVFCLQAFISAPVAIWLGAKMSFLGFVSGVAIGVVGIFLWASLAMILTVLIRNYVQRDLVVNLTMLPLMFSAPVLYPLHSAPVYLQVLGRINPVTAQVQAIRNALTSPGGDFFSLSALATCSLSILAVVVCTVVFSRAEFLPSER